MIPVQLVSMSMIFTGTNLINLSANLHETYNKICIINFSRPPHSYFWLFTKSCSRFEALLSHNHSRSHVGLRPLQMFESLPFWNRRKLGIKKHDVEITFSGINCLLHFFKKTTDNGKRYEGRTAKYGKWQHPLLTWHTMWWSEAF
jgi:hypothetical protein